MLPSACFRTLRCRPVESAGDCGALAAGAVAAAALSAAPLSIGAQQDAGLRVFHVRETAGIRRTAYPVTVTFQLPKGALSDATHARMMTNSAEVAAQFTARASWDDGSVQTLDMDFSAEPRSRRRPPLRAAVRAVRHAGHSAGARTGRQDQPDAIVVGNLKFSKSGSPQLASVSYRGEGHRHGIERAHHHRLHRPPAWTFRRRRARRLEIVKGGPLMVLLHYTATLPIDETTTRAGGPAARDAEHQERG